MPVRYLNAEMPVLTESRNSAIFPWRTSRADIPRGPYSQSWLRGGGRVAEILGCGVWGVRAGTLPIAGRGGERSAASFRLGGYAPGVISAEAAEAAGQRGRDAGGHRGLRLRWALLVALAGGLLLAASFPPFGIWPLAAVGVALLTVALAGRGLRASFLAGLVFGVAFFFPLLSWVLNVWWFAYIALALGSAVILAVLAVAQRLLLRLPGWPVAVAGWWVALEALRDRFPFGGFPWGRLAMGQAAAPDAGWAAVGGAPVLSFVVALTGACLAWLILAVWARRGAEATAPRRPLAWPA